MMWLYLLHYFNDKNKFYPQVFLEEKENKREHGRNLFRSLSEEENEKKWHVV